MKYEIISGGERLNDGMITGPYSVLVIADDGDLRKVISTRNCLQSLAAATQAEDDFAAQYHGAEFPWGRIAA